VRSTPTVANRSVYLRTDSAYGNPLDWVSNFPQPALIGRVPNVRLIMDGTAPLIPFTTGGFVNGVWNGAFRIDTAATNVLLRVVDGEGHFGQSNPFALVSPPALGVRRLGNSVELTFHTLAGLSYVVEASPSLNGEWNAISGILLGDGGLLQFPVIPAINQQFFRVRILPYGRPSGDGNKGDPR
jgi:hypothetical protein